MDYYREKFFLAKVDKDNKIIGKVERWSAHEKAILHRGFTMILTYQNQYLLQHRRHPAFDKFWDLSFSSHPIYLSPLSSRAKRGISLQSDLDAIYFSLEREWNLKKSDLVSEPKFLGKIYYKARDPNSIYTEHEFDYIYKSELKHLPQPNPEYSYGFKVLENWKPARPAGGLEIRNFLLCPWVEKILNEIF